VQIKKVSIIGLGALGILYGNHFSKRIPKEDLRIIADQERIDRYKRDQVFCNRERCDFDYVTPEEHCEPADLLIFTVKYDGLKSAIEAVKNHVGEKTIILSALNGISSEEIIGERYGMDKVLFTVAQGMDAVKVGNHLTCASMGLLCIGEREEGIISENVKRVAAFFDKTEFPYEIETNMMKRQWGKFMANVGVNQAVAVYGGSFGDTQKAGEVRETMIAAMKEVIALSKEVGINLTEADLTYWITILDKLNPEGKPSMAQDVEAKRYSEVELFSGTVLRLGEKYGVSTPVNKALYERIKAIESEY